MNEDSTQSKESLKFQPELNRPRVTLIGLTLHLPKIDLSVQIFLSFFF